MVNKRTQLDNGWILETDEDANSMNEYKILRIFAFFGHGIYMPIDTRDFTQEQWDMFHMRIKEMGNK